MSTEIAEPIDINKVSEGLSKFFEGEGQDAIVSPAQQVIPAETHKDDAILEKKEEPLKKDTEQKSETNEDEPPEVLPNQGRNETWKKFTAAHKQTKKELVGLRQEMQEKLADFEGTKKERDEYKGKIEELTSKIDQLSKIDSLARLEADPEFQSKYVVSKNKAIDQLKEQASYGEINEHELVAAIAKTGKDRVSALEDLLSTAPSIVRTKVLSLIDQIDGIDAKRSEELSNAKESFEKLNLERESRNKAQREEAIKRTEELFNKKSSTLQKQLGVSEDIIKSAKDFFFKNDDPEKAIEVIIKGLSHDSAKGSESEKDKKIAEMEKELEKYRNGEPGLGSGKADIPAKDNDDFATAIAKGVKQLGIR